jgi:NADH:ubiquinone oxidoreductase subunit K
MTLQVYLLISLFLFCIGLVTVFSRRNLITILIGVELLMNAANLNFMAFNHFTAPDPVVGQVIVLIVIGISAAEVSIFLAIILALYRYRRNINVESLNSTKG